MPHGHKKLLICFLLVGVNFVAAAGDQFVYSGFARANLTLDGVAVVTPTGLLELTNGTLQKTHAIHPATFRFCKPYPKRK